MTHINTVCNDDHNCHLLCGGDFFGDLPMTTTREAAMEAALLKTRQLVCEAAEVGFNYADGDWADRLYRNNGNIAAALSTPAADTRVVVKPLVWEAYAQGEISRPNDVHPEYCTAPSVSKERSGEWRLRGPWIGFNYYPTKEAAKSAAQAHADAAHWKNTQIVGE